MSPLVCKDDSCLIGFSTLVLILADVGKYYIKVANRLLGC